MMKLVCRIYPQLISIRVLMTLSNPIERTNGPFRSEVDQVHFRRFEIMEFENCHSFEVGANFYALTLFLFYFTQL